MGVKFVSKAAAPSISFSLLKVAGGWTLNCIGDFATWILYDWLSINVFFGCPLENVVSSYVSIPVIKQFIILIIISMIFSLSFHSLIIYLEKAILPTKVYIYLHNVPSVSYSLIVGGWQLMSNPYNDEEVIYIHPWILAVTDRLYWTFAPTIVFVAWKYWPFNCIWLFILLFTINVLIQNTALFEHKMLRVLLTYTILPSTLGYLLRGVLSRDVDYWRAGFSSPDRYFLSFITAPYHVFFVEDIQQMLLCQILGLLYCEMQNMDGDHYRRIFWPQEWQDNSETSSYRYIMAAIDLYFDVGFMYYFLDVTSIGFGYNDSYWGVFDKQLVDMYGIVVILLCQLGILWAPPLHGS